jgi:hypothetical protein
MSDKFRTFLRLFFYVVGFATLQYGFYRGSFKLFFLCLLSALCSIFFGDWLGEKPKAKNE